MLRKLGEAIRLLTSNLGLFSSIILSIWLPGTLLVEFLRFYGVPGTDETSQVVRDIQLNNFIETGFGPIYVAALIHALAQLKQGRRVTYTEAMTAGYNVWGRLFLARLVTGFYILGGLLLFIIPGIILSLRYALLDSIVTLEELYHPAARRRSTELTKGKRWQILGATLLTFALIFAVSTVIAIVLYAPLNAAGQTDNFWVATLYGCFNSVLFALLPIVLFLYYWEARHQDEQGN